MLKTIVETRNCQGRGNGINPETLVILLESVQDKLNPCNTCKDKDRDHDPVQQDWCHYKCKAYNSIDKYGVVTTHDYFDIHKSVDGLRVSDWALLYKSVS